MRTTEASSILIVEDNAELREVITELLRSEGYRVAETEDGEQALALCEELGPCLVLLDMNLPGMCGDQVLTRIQQMPGEPPAVIAMTGGHEISPLVAAVLQKPFEVTELLDLARRYCGPPRRLRAVVSTVAAL